MPPGAVEYLTRLERIRCIIICFSFETAADVEGRVRCFYKVGLRHACPRFGEAGLLCL